MLTDEQAQEINLRSSCVHTAISASAALRSEKSSPPLTYDDIVTGAQKIYDFITTKSAAAPNSEETTKPN